MDDNRDNGKRKRNVDNWADSVRKRRRNLGEQYVSKRGAVRPARVFNPDTNCCKTKVSHGTKKKQKKQAYCSYKTLSEENRRLIFNQFWSLGDYDAQNAHLFGLLEKLQTKCHKHRKNPNEIRRTQTLNYYLRKPDGLKIQVCKKAFLMAFSLCKSRIETIQSKLRTHNAPQQDVSVAPKDQRGRHNNRPRAFTDEQRNFIYEHINSFPLSHYRRSSAPHKRYITAVHSVAEMYREYKRKCDEASQTPLSLSYYRKIFNENFNISFKTPQGYHNKMEGDKCWEAIGQELHKTADERKKAWGNLRNLFNRQVSNVSTGQSQDSCERHTEIYVPDKTKETKVDSDSFVVEHLERREERTMQKSDLVDFVSNIASSLETLTEESKWKFKMEIMKLADAIRAEDINKQRQAASHAFDNASATSNIGIPSSLSYLPQVSGIIDEYNSSG